jgi:hypothetical protein
VAGVAAVLLEQPVSLGDLRRRVGDELHRALVALHARRLDVRVREHRVVPVVLLVPAVLLLPLLLLVLVGGAVVGAHEVEGLAAAAVADRAPDVLEGVRRLRREEQVEPRVRAQRLLVVVRRPTFAVGRHVTRRAHVDALRLREVQLEGEVVEDDLLDLERRTDEVEARRIADLVGDDDGLVLRIELVDALADALLVARPGSERLLRVADLRHQRRRGGRARLRGALGLLLRECRDLDPVEGAVELLLLGFRVPDHLAVLLDEVARPVVVRLRELRLLVLHVEVALERELRRRRLVELRLVRADVRARLLDGGLERGLALARGRRLERGEVRFRLLQLDLAELALVVLPRSIPVGHHHPQRRDQEREAREQEPLVQRQGEVVGISAVGHRITR